MNVELNIHDMLLLYVNTSLFLSLHTLLGRGDYLRHLSLSLFLYDWFCDFILNDTEPIMIPTPWGTVSLV